MRHLTPVAVAGARFGTGKQKAVIVADSLFDRLLNAGETKFSSQRLGVCRLNNLPPAPEQL